jgi:peptidoglycan/LPS O-acetylase OafA/YrhL
VNPTLRSGRTGRPQSPFQIEDDRLMFKFLADIIREDLSGVSVASVRRMACLDGVRGLAALTVALDHLSCSGYYLFPYCDLKAAGGAPVAMFFVLSSFLLSVPLLTRQEEELKHRKVWRNYAIRRFLRIYPVFSVVLFFYAFRGVFGSAALSLSQGLDYVLAHLTLQRGEHIFWAVNVEVKYYLVLPFLILMWAFILRRNLGLAFVLCLSVAMMTFHLAPPEQWLVGRTLHLATYVSVFLMGLLAAIIHTKIMDAGGLLSERAQWILELTAVFTFVILVLMIPSIWDNAVSDSFSPNEQSWRWYLWGLLSTLFLVSQLHGRGFVRRALAWQPIRILGLMSFSIYLWHYPVLSVFSKVSFPVGSTGLAVIALILIISFFSYLLIERPFLKLGKRLCRDGSSSPVQAFVTGSAREC